jgi:hypothetical protein
MRRTQSKIRRLAYGENVLGGLGRGYPYDLSTPPMVYIEALMHFIGFPTCLLAMEPSDEDTFSHYVESLICDDLLPFAKTNFSAMSCRKRRSLYQELEGVITSSRRIILSSKSQMGHIMAPSNPFESHLAKMLGRKRILSSELQAIIQEACETDHVEFDGTCPLRRSPKRDLLHWIEVNWDELGQLLTAIAANQNTLPMDVVQPH